MPHQYLFHLRQTAYREAAQAMQIFRNRGTGRRRSGEDHFNFALALEHLHRYIGTQGSVVHPQHTEQEKQEDSQPHIFVPFTHGPIPGLIKFTQFSGKNQIRELC